MKNKSIILFTTIFAALAIISIVLRCNLRPALVEEKIGLSDESAHFINSIDISIAKSTTGTNSISIPLPGNTSFDKISVYSDYVRQILVVSVYDADRDFFKDKTVEGKGINIISAKCLYSSINEEGYLCFDMDGVYEYTIDESVKDKLTLNVQKPDELYNKIVVIDTDLDEFGTEIKELIDEKLSPYEVKAYFTTDENIKLADNDIVKMADSVNADLYIKVSRVNSRASSGNIENITTYYNDKIFLPEYTNLSFAQRLERDIVYAFGGNEAVVKPDKADSILQLIEIPAAEVDLPEEMLTTQQAKDKIAEGITNAILYSYKETEGDTK